MKIAHNQPTQEYLNECFRYDPKTGHLFWKVRPLHHFNSSHGMNITNSQFSNHRAGTLQSKGYVAVMVNGKGYRAHRIIWMMIHGLFPPDELDHVNHQRDDNRIENLRLATSQENKRNSSISHWENARLKPRLGGTNDGFTNKVDRLRLLGNGVVPQTAAKAWITLNERFYMRHVYE
jgi:hypothetical protein